VQLLDQLLITAGHEGIFGWRWRDMVNNNGLDSSARVFSLYPTQTPLSGFTLTERPEINALCQNAQGQLFAGCGDGTVYGWDLNHLSGSTEPSLQLSGHTDAVFGLANLRQNGLASCAEDGVVRIWDIREQKCRAILNPSADRKVISREKGSWLGCVAVDEAAQWLVCGGGSRLLTVFHLASLQPTASLPVSGTCQALVLHEHQVVSTGNDGHLYRFQTNGSLVSKIRTNAPSNFTITVAPSPQQLTVVGGLHRQLDVFVNPVVRAFGLTCAR
jgi:WD40 repeat protein